VYHISETKSLNKSGYVVDDLHVLISVAGANIGGGGGGSSSLHNEEGKEAVEGGSYRSRNPLASSSGVNSHYQQQRPLKNCKLIILFYLL
jgi:hypothetical protein